jgi:hypothetical protein
MSDGDVFYNVVIKNNSAFFDLRLGGVFRRYKVGSPVIIPLSLLKLILSQDKFIDGFSITITGISSKAEHDAMLAAGNKHNKELMESMRIGGGIHDGSL